jgi:hypothetical protein
MHVRVVHALPGRIRLHISEMKANPTLAADIEQRLTGRPGFDQVLTNPLTGSLLLHFDARRRDSAVAHLTDSLPGFSAQDLEKGLEASKNGEATKALYAGDVSALFRHLDKRIEKRTGVVDLRLLVPVCLALMAAGALILAALRRKSVPLPSWYDLLWFAFNTFIILNLPIGDPERTKDKSQ